VQSTAPQRTEKKLIHENVKKVIKYLPLDQYTLTTSAVEPAAVTEM
jgi:hypothetical protein